MVYALADTWATDRAKDQKTETWLRREDDIKIFLKQYDVRAWVGFSWLMMSRVTRFVNTVGNVRPPYGVGNFLIS